MIATLRADDMQTSSDKRQCIDLIQSFAYFVDHHEFDNAVELFTEDAVFERPDSTAQGREEIAALWAGRSSDVITRHLCGEPYFKRIDEFEAETVTQVVLYQTVREGEGLPVANTPVAMAEFCDQLVKTDAGWKIKHRLGVPVMIISK